MGGSEKMAQWNPYACNSVYFDDYTTAYWSSRTNENEWVMSCNAQNEVLNRFFTIGTSCLSGSTMIYGLIMDKYGCRTLRLSGMFAFAVSCILFTIAANEPRSKLNLRDI